MKKVRFQYSLNTSKVLSFNTCHDEVSEGGFSITPLCMDNGELKSDIFLMNDTNPKKIGQLKISQQVFAIDSTIQKTLDVFLEISDDALDFNNLLSQESVQFEQFKFKLMKSLMKLGNMKFFSRISIYEDFQAKLISEQLFSLLYDLENKFREVIDRVLTIELGPNWTESLDGPYSLKKKKGALAKDIVEYNFMDERLYNLLTDQLIQIIEPQKYAISPETSNVVFVQEKLLDIMQLLLDKNSTNEERVQHLIESGLFTKTDTMSHLDQFFKELGNEGGNRIFQNNWAIATKYRNHIAHTKLLDLSFYSKVVGLFNKLLKDFELFLEIKTFSKYIENSKLFVDPIIQDELLHEKSKVDDLNYLTDEDVIFRDGVVELSEYENELILKEIIENETGVIVREESEIQGLFEEIINIKIDELFSALHDNGAEIIVNNSVQFDKMGQILLEAKHAYILSKKIVVHLNDASIDDTKGSNSYVELTFDFGDENKKIVVKYKNGDYSFDAHQGIYIPESEDMLDASDLEEYVDELIDEPDQVIPNLMNMINNDIENYIRARDGGEPLLIEEECPYCWAYESVTTEEKYFDLAEIKWEGNTAICLECGEKCTVGENAQGYIKVVEYGEDPFEYDLIIKDD
ncbi:hypothetical protein [Enterococcus wangshanyuanii]|uniref:Apea-like HEPN domain-containing protein n=1 Tax=Enterococcus wangshanyuanii TaxID=2005703 RepID=A0ABQ1NR77_9ENTE|nr:hypothetical protein [Enterococcus wangshanyuanii]GGC83452.1 hypothetical protein GCM10011573_11350 [Enterococcus wangshanyuanii]